MNRYFFAGILVIATLSYLGVTADASEPATAVSHHKKSLQSPSHRQAPKGRGLASLGQAEQILYGYSGSARPARAAPLSAAERLRIGAACAGSCEQTTGASVSDYFGSAQRQAGATLGMSVGK